MQAKAVVLLFGVVLAVAGAVWWFAFYGGAADRLFQDRGTFLREALPCLVYSTDMCRTVRGIAELAGFTVYSPVVLWAAIVCLVVGLVLPTTRRTA